MSYHISTESGEPRICRARPGHCPLGTNMPHFESKDAARVFFEDLMEKTMDSLTSKKRSTTNTSNVVPGLKLRGRSLYISGEGTISGRFTAKAEFICGACGKHVQKASVTPVGYNGSRFAASQCSWCGETNMFQTGTSARGNPVFATLE